MISQSMISQSRRKKLRRLFRTVFQPPLPEERVKDMADLIGTATTVEQVTESIEGLSSLSFPVDLVVSRIHAILSNIQEEQNPSFAKPS